MASAVLFLFAGLGLIATGSSVLLGFGVISKALAGFLRINWALYHGLWGTWLFPFNRRATYVAFGLWFVGLAQVAMGIGLMILAIQRA